MIRFDRGAGICLLFIAVAAIATPASAGKFTKPGVGKELPRNLPTENLQEVPQAQPEPLGWPSAISTGTPVDCSREPLANEVIVATDAGFGGSCARLVPGFYPYAANLVVGNDVISAIKVGSDVRARVYKNPVYASDWNLYRPGTRSAGLGDFNDKISSMRVEPTKRSAVCDDLREGEIALFENDNWQGDCVVLPGVGEYPNAESMGIENDSITSLNNNSALTMQVFWHPNMSKSAMLIPAHSKVDRLPTGGWNTNGINDDISSLRMW